ncbi:MAG: response regulator receiver protein [Labilithrix sp.]|nr:response regulator receiver protein [Labilithrix sp.]
MKRILFVDDEANVLDGLRASLRKHRNDWAMEFALGGERALALLELGSYDVIVTDLRMPRVDGVTLLKHVRTHHPQTVRIVLSGDPERNKALAVIPYAHQSLTKPCGLAELEGVLARACVLGDLVADPEVRSLVGSLGALPPLPQTYARLVRVLEDDNSCTVDVAAVIASDIAVTAKVLQLANSAFFGAGRSVTTVTQAIPLFGREALKCLTLSTGLFDPKTISPHIRQLGEQLHEHSQLVASLASDLAPERDRRDAFSAGMLHDVGKLVLASGMPDAMEDARHAKVGAYLLALWGLPATVIDAVGRHHDDCVGRPPTVAAVHHAERINDEVLGGLRSATVSEIEEMKQRVAALVAERDAEKAA